MWFWASISTTLGDWGTFGLFVIALGGALLAFRRWLKREVVEPLQAVPGMVTRQAEIARDTAESREIAERVEQQFYNNGGSTLRDTVDLVGKNLIDHIKESQQVKAAMIEQQETLAQELAAHRSSVARSISSMQETLQEIRNGQPANG